MTTLDLTYPAVPWSAPGELVLEDSCLLMVWDNGIHGKGGDARRHKIVWPPGFHPALENGVLKVVNGGERVIASIGDKLEMAMVAAGGDSKGTYDQDCDARLQSAILVANSELPTAFLQHTEEWSVDELAVSVEYYASRIMDEHFRLAYKRGQLEKRNGCMRIGGSSILVWPANFSMSEDSGVIEVMDENRTVIAREGMEVALKGKTVSFNDRLGMEILDRTPIDCQNDRSNYWFVSG